VNINARWNFDRWADSYDSDVLAVSVQKESLFQDYNRVLASVVEYSGLTKGNIATVLDIGIGTGNSAVHFLDMGMNVIGIDPSQEMRRRCHEKHPEISVLDGDFLHIPLASDSVDVIVSSYALHHLAPEEKDVSVLEMKRVLRIGGTVVVADLMFENAEEETLVKQRLHDSGRNDILDAVADEYFSLLDVLRNQFTKAFFSFTGMQLTPLVWIFKAVLDSK
jgi:putative AdoMet-dependent methyltransferase